MFFKEISQCSTLQILIKKYIIHLHQLSQTITDMAQQRFFSQLPQEINLNQSHF